MVGKCSTPEATRLRPSLTFEKDVNWFLKWLSLHIGTRQCGVKAGNWNPRLPHPRTLFPSCQGWTPANPVSSGFAHLAAGWRGAKDDGGLAFSVCPVWLSPGLPGLGGRLGLRVGV